MGQANQAMDTFCGSPFWNTTLTWESEDPDFTSCFEKTVLIWIPCMFLLLFAPLEILYIKKSINRDIPWNWKNVLKLFITCLICAIFLSEFVLSARSDIVHKVNVFMPLVKIVTFSLSGTLAYFNKKYGLQTSGLQFLFWLLCSVCGAFQLRTQIRATQNGESPENYNSYISYLIYYPMAIAMLLLNCFSEGMPKMHPYKIEEANPSEYSSFLSRVLYTYVDGILYKGFRRPLEKKDMWNLSYEDEAQYLGPLFEKEFQKRVAKNNENHFKKYPNDKTKQWRKPVSVMPVIWKCFYAPFITAVCCKLLTDFITFVNPQLLGLLISHVGSGEPLWKGIIYAVTMFVTGSLTSIIHNVHFNKLWHFGLRSRSVLMTSIYRKTLRISNVSRKEKTIGEIVNLMAVDAEKFVDFSMMFPLLWSAPLQIILAMYFLWQELGPSVLSGLALMILLIPINGFIIRRSKALQVRQMKQKDERVKMMNDILNGIKVLKLYAWEPSFEKIVANIRNKEIVTLRKSAYLNAGTGFLWNCAPFLVSFVTFGTYVLVDENNTLNPTKAFVSLSLLNILRMPMNMIPNVINSVVQLMVSIKRINSFLNADELDQYVNHDMSEVNPLLIENGSFSWGEEPILKNINIKVPKSSLTAVVGPVGSGKSSLITALLGEMEKTSGRVNTYGTIAYVPQQAWIQNATVRENIIFGKPFDKVRYNKVIDACALRPDLQILGNSDQTEIGEKGINLSGGQKQRISLARAVYADADVYLLDDPLSAVDSHVGKHIFHHLIGATGMLRNKVRVLVTHAVTYLPQTQNIVVLKDGEITESGNYEELVARKGAFSEFLMQHITEDVDDETELDEIEEQLQTSLVLEDVKKTIYHQRSRISESSSHNDIVGSGRSISQESIRSNKSLKKKLSPSLPKMTEQEKKAFKGKLTEIEKTEKGNVKLSVFSYYLAAVGGLIILSTVLFYTCFHGFGIGTNVWLGLWSEDPDMIVDGNVNTALRNMYLWVYAALGLAQGLSILAANIIFANGTTNAASKLHNILMRTVMRLPMSFFDITPSGRIIARFSSDINGVDLRLPNNFNNFFINSLKVIGTLLVICYTTPIFVSVVIPTTALYLFIQRYFVSTSRQIKRLESVSRSPIYSHFGETVSGTSVIRAYKSQDRFINESERKINSNQMCIYPSNSANRWLAVRLETLGNLIVLTAAIFAVLRKDLNPAMVGLSVSYALQITVTLNMLVRTISDVEATIVCVERIKEYGEATQELPWEIQSRKPENDWPDKGVLEFKDYGVRYRPGLDLVLRGISFGVLGGEKIGIVGRTGAGKSSLTLSLFRIIEASQGEISIDGIKISEIGLHDLRSRLTIIPQDAILFSGSLRLNLDPFDKYSDDEVWKAVACAHLKGFIKSLSAGLYHMVSEGGENLSVGQRQLICLARALLRKTKILVLDEATAAVDLETDDLIQKTIRTEFNSCTVLTIAHRLNTILDSDKVLVLDKGKIAEFDSPGALLKNKDSIFYGMCKDAGLAS